MIIAIFNIHINIKNTKNINFAPPHQWLNARCWKGCGGRNKPYMRLYDGSFEKGGGWVAFQIYTG